MESIHRRTLGDLVDLRERMRATEVLFESMSIEPIDLGAYWSLSTDLLRLLEETEAYMGSREETGDEDRICTELRGRLTKILAGSEEINRGIPSAEVDEEGD